MNFTVTECKSGVDSNFISRHDAAQLSHSMNWFATAYDNSCQAIPILIHKSEYVHQQAVRTLALASLPSQRPNSCVRR